MLTFMIPVERASEETVKALLEAGILYVDQTGMHVTEKSCADQSKQD